MPVRWRLTLFNALAIGSILVALGLALFFLLRGTLLASVEDTARDRAVAVARSIASGEGLEEEDGRLVLDDDLVDGITLDGVFIIVRDDKGNVIARTIDLPAGREARDEVWRAALSAGRPAYGTLALSEEGPDYVYAVPVEPSGGPARVVEAGKAYGPAVENVRRVALVLAAGIGVAFLFSVVGAYLLARAALSPVGAVAKAARRITEEDLSQRLPVSRRRDEISVLTATINEMLSRLEGAFARLGEALARQRRFAADASHELRTPLTSINGYAQILEEWGLEDPTVAPESVAAIKRETGRMMDLVEDLLTLTRGDEGVPLDLRRGDMAGVAAEAVEAARASAGGKVQIEYAPPEEPVEAVFDREGIRRAVTILLDNAVKYTPEGGGVKVEAGRKDGGVYISVSDTGIGIPEEKLPHVFERFYRADEARGSEGAGLGLAIAWRIMESHGGAIRARSVPNKGSVFTLSVPRRDEFPDATPRAGSSLPKPVDSKK